MVVYPSTDATKRQGNVKVVPKSAARAPIACRPSSFAHPLASPGKTTCSFQDRKKQRHGGVGRWVFGWADDEFADHHHPHTTTDAEAVRKKQKLLCISEDPH